MNSPIGRNVLIAVGATLTLGIAVTVVALNRPAAEQEQAPPPSVKGAEEKNDPRNLNAPQDFAAPPSPRTAQVNVSANGFSPPVVDVPKGSTVVWINNDLSPHYIAPDDHPDHLRYRGKWDDDRSGYVTPGANTSQTFFAAGTFGYHDHLFPQFRGTVIVRE